MEPRKREWTSYQSSRFSGLYSSPPTGISTDNSLLILLHGVGSNEWDLTALGEVIAPGSTLVSLRAPIELMPGGYGWFHVRFEQSGPVHNWIEARTSARLLEEEIADLRKRFGISPERTVVFGFSQGGIMALGLALTGKMPLGGYVVSSARTLPEFAAEAREARPNLSKRPIFLAHGAKDEKLPVTMAHQSRDLIAEFSGELTNREYPFGHGIPDTLIQELKAWIPVRFTSKRP